MNAQCYGVRREAKRHAALDFADLALTKPAYPGPSGGNPKRRRRCALPAHSKTSHDLDENREAIRGLGFGEFLN